VPDWVRNPEDKILTVVYGAIVGGLGTGLAMLVRTIQQTGSDIRGAFIDAGLALESAGGSAGRALTSVPRDFRWVFLEAGVSGGLVAPLTVAVLTLLSLGVMVLVIGAIGFIVRLVIPP
jgi:hypothetical protein